MSTHLLNRHRCCAVLLSFVLCVGLSAPPAAGKEPVHTVSLYDSRTKLPSPLSFENLAQKTGWLKLADTATDHQFTGAAVMLNEHLAIAFRRGGPGAEVYVRGKDLLCLRASIAASDGAANGKLEGIHIVGHSSKQARVEATFRTPEGKLLGMRFELAARQWFVKTESCAGTTALCLAAPCRFAILPDFFADDIVVDAVEILVATADLPSENFLLHMIPGGRSIVMTVAGTRDHDAQVNFSGKGAERRIDRTHIPYGKDRKVWVAVLEGQGIWHECDIQKKDAGKVLALDWKWPFTAQWRVDWRQQGGLSASWEMLVEQASGDYEKYGWFGGPPRTFAAKDLGRYGHTCWVDRGGSGHLRPASRDYLGPAILYPINRVQQTPLDRYTVVDVVRATLGMGPCEYVLDVEGQRAVMKGIATCGARGVLGRIYESKQQKAKRAQIEKALVDVVVFVKDIRARIDQYVAFARAIRAYLDEQRKARPELASFLQELDTIAARIETNFQQRKAVIQEPQYVVDLTEKFRRTLLDYEGPDALEKCNAITEAIVKVGGTQDGLVAGSRQTVKILRQRAGLALATDPRAAPIAREIRRRTQEILRNPTTYEHPRP
jgi:hypothetical protein